MKIAILGLGEAGSHFANDLVKLGVEVSGWDPDLKRDLHSDVHFASSNSDAVRDADVIFSANYTSESEQIAEEVKPYIKPGAFYCEMNTSSPQKKASIERILTGTNCHVIDLAIMAPVPPHGIQVPLLASGKQAKNLSDKLSNLGLDITYLSDTVGDAAKRKLLRSIVYKGFAAVVCEAMEAGAKFGMKDFIREQIQSIIGDRSELIERFLSGSRTHAKRRMHEMEAVVDMLESEDLDAFVSKGSVQNLKKYTSA